MSEDYEPLASKEAYLRALADEQAVLKNTSQRISAIAAGARFAGATWLEVGVALGTSPQAAQQRFGRP